jgi:hypothetical protein
MDPVLREAFESRLAKGALYYVWVFDPQSGEVELIDPEADPLGIPSHDELAQKYPHPERVHGYAYRIPGGAWRITDWEHKQIEDPYVSKTLLATLSDH